MIPGHLALYATAFPHALTEISTYAFSRFGYEPTAVPMTLDNPSFGHWITLIYPQRIRDNGKQLQFQLPHFIKLKLGKNIKIQTTIIT